MTTDLETRVAGGLEILASLERLGAATATSLELPVDLSYERYEALLSVLGRAHRTLTWVIADAINEGEKRYGEKYAQAVELLNMTPETLMNYASIARKVPRERRRVGVPFSVHALVAPLEPSQQTLWLDRTVKNDWTRAELREKLHPPASQNGSHSGVMEDDLEEAARFLIASAQRMGDGFLVRDGAFRQLCALLGEEV